MNAVFDEESLHRLERELGVSLPDTYRRVLLDYPFEVDSYTYWWDLFGNVDRIIEYNTECRDNGFFGQAWPSHYLVIGGDGTGGVYFLDLKKERDRIFYAEHETTAWSDALAITEAKEDAEEFEEEEAPRETAKKREDEEAEERRRNKKWWQFWI